MSSLGTILGLDRSRGGRVRCCSRGGRGGRGSRGSSCSRGERGSSCSSGCRGCIGGERGEHRG